MAGENWAAKLLGNLLIAAGLCIAGLSGLCAGLQYLFVPWSAVSMEGLAIPLVSTGFPLAGGATAVLVGRGLIGFKPERSLGWAGVLGGGLICAAALYLAAVKPSNSLAIGITSAPTWTASWLGLGLIAGFALLATSVWELRRSPVRPLG